MLKKGNIYRFICGRHIYLLIYKGLTSDNTLLNFEVLYCSSGLYKRGQQGTLTLKCENELEEVEKMSEVILELL